MSPNWILFPMLIAAILLPIWVMLDLRGLDPAWCAIC